MVHTETDRRKRITTMPEFDNTKPIKDMISKAYRAGVCDIDGHSITVNGKPTKSPRSFSGSTAKTYRWDNETSKLKLVGEYDGV